jgi:hypothetical protein
MMTTDDSRPDSPDGDDGNPDAFSERPWIDLKTTHDVESWIDHYNWDLQRAINKPNPTGAGVCFVLVHGGEIFMHTTGELILLDVTPEAAWVAPVITAATGTEAPSSQIWTLPGDRLTELVLGLNSLIASTRIIISHPFKARRY